MEHGLQVWEIFGRGREPRASDGIPAKARGYAAAAHLLKF